MRGKCCGERTYERLLPCAGITLIRFTGIISDRSHWLQTPRETLKTYKLSLCKNWCEIRKNPVYCNFSKTCSVTHQTTWFMKKIFYSLLLLAFGPAVLAQQPTIKDPNAQVREAKNFTVIRLSSAFDVYLTQGAEESVAVSAAETEYLADIKVEVKNGVLDISYRPKKGWGRGNRKLKAYISFKQLDKLDVSGACDVDIVGVWKADGAKIELSGASDLAGQVNITKLNFDISGASDVKLTGNVGQLVIDASGASSFKGFDLAADYCTADVSGASDVRILVNKELSVIASGASDVHYKGSGLIRDVRTSGASSVKRSS